VERFGRLRVAHREAGCKILRNVGRLSKQADGLGLNPFARDIQDADIEQDEEMKHAFAAAVAASKLKPEVRHTFSAKPKTEGRSPQGCKGSSAASRRC